MQKSESREIQTKLLKGVLDLTVLKFLNAQDMHGYQIISQIRRSFGVYFGASTIYPLLASLEKKGYLTSQWNTNGERPKKVYMLTPEGKKRLTFTEDTLNFICRKLGLELATEVKQLVEVKAQ